VILAEDIHVVILEDDPFARNWMVLVGVRDWRTRVVGEINEPSQLISILNDKSTRKDLLIMDTDIPGGENWIPRIINTIKEIKENPKVLCTGINPNPRVLSQLTHPAFAGYIIKDEINYSLAWAVSFAIEGKWVITDSIQELASSIGFLIPKPCVVLDGRNVIGFLDERKANVARLALLFSIERRELADELCIGTDWSYQMVSQVYKELGIWNLLEDEDILQDYFGDNKIMFSYIRRIQKELREKKKPKDMETLAFHMITMPEIWELN